MAEVKATFVSSVTVDADDTDTTVANVGTLRGKAQAALASNATYIGLASPSTAQNTAQVKALTRQVNALIRLLLNQLDTISDT